MNKDNIKLDLNNTIVEAVKARVEAEMFTALSGDATMTALIQAALNQQVKASNDPYRHETEPYIHHVLRLAIQEAAKLAVQKFITEEAESIEAAVRKTLRKELNAIAQTLAGSLVEAADRAYGVDVAVSLRMPRSS